MSHPLASGALASGALASAALSSGAPVSGALSRVVPELAADQTAADKTAADQMTSDQLCADQSLVAQLLAFVRAHSPLCVLTGAGLSVASGIPAYRDAAGSWQRPAPVQAADFLRSARARRRYWLRSLHGWPAFAAARPNSGHFSLVTLAAQGVVASVITQNVDGLHQTAGSQDVVDLHGCLNTVRCLDCAAIYHRADIQSLLANLNVGMLAMPAVQLADGDASLLAESDELLDAVRVPECGLCGGILKPTVVFFGDSIAPAVWHAADHRLSATRGLLVIGSSLSVYSGMRMCRRAHAAQLPIAALNRGWTRGDALLQLKLDAEAAPLLTALVVALGEGRP